MAKQLCTMLQLQGMKKTLGTGRCLDFSWVLKATKETTTQYQHNN
jgi:penicillin V acylase-like amidase (Ntn superfamily)